MTPYQRILVVDDDEAFRYTLARSLRRRGLEAFEAATGDEARAMLMTERPDACVLDLKLDGESGLHLLPEPFWNGLTGVTDAAANTSSSIGH